MNFFEKGELKLLWPFYLESFLSNILFFMPAFIIPYFLSLNFSVFQIGLIIAAQQIAGIIFEIPTGAFADIYGRKKSVILAQVLAGILMIALFLTKNYYLILSIFFLIGISATFQTGSYEAWPYDLIKKNKKKKYIKKYFTKVQSISGIGLLLSGIIGAFLVKWAGLNFIWIAASGSFIIGALVLTFGQEDFVRKKSNIKDSFSRIKNQTEKSLEYCKGHKLISYFIIANFVLVFAASFNEGLTWTPLLIELGFPNYGFGYIWTGIAAALMISPWLYSLASKKTKELKFILPILMISSIILIPVLFINNMWILIAIMITSLFFFSSRRPPERILFHRLIPSKQRATIGSIESMFLSLSYAIAIPIVGLAVDSIGPRYSIILTFILSIPAIILYSKIKE